MVSGGGRGNCFRDDFSGGQVAIKLSVCRQSLSPSPQPSPQGEGELSAIFSVKGDPISLGARTAPSPRGEGWGEGDKSATDAQCSTTENIEEPEKFTGRE